METLRDFLDTLRRDEDVRAVVLQATGRSFSSGFDLTTSLRVAGTDGASPRAEVILQKLCDELEAFPLPTVCALNGGVYGGATDLALACDFRIGTMACKLRMPAAQLGICFYPSGLRRYVTRLGLGVSKRLFLAGEEMNAEELAKAGFLDRLVPDSEDLVNEVERLVKRLVLLPRIAGEHTKRSLNHAAHQTLDGTSGDLAFRQSLESAEFADALQAWSQRKS